MSYPFIKMPDGVILDEATGTDSHGKFSIQPLERGFGVTLGNSFRRVLLSSIAGAAITAIKIDGILHEFTSVPGVAEDVTEIILNLKKVRMRILNKKAYKIELSLVGPCNFTAADLQKNCPDIEILTPDLHIATLNSNTKLNMELRFGFGKGYVPAGNQEIVEQSIGLIPIDSIFTPIKTVTYDVQNVRIGESNEYEQLALNITTDGSITPEDALSTAGTILRDHINMFINFEVEQEEHKVESEKDVESERIRKILITPVDDLELSVRSHNCLKAANIKLLADLVKKDESEMLKFRNFGRKSLAELIEIVENFGLDFGMDVDKYINDKTETK
ncbi:MAG: DNA-directed RNA polymerase subunit alpha [Bacteroidetes bacterium]|nr:DNA-directed RNA polymerase subunit alpha [Bacteroidota bacterium]MBU1677433.1 DNA-directed RNA polymerase subunit alpha [Bacteroidota bacterium]MBU2506162.1 DNA-directed RNA polymerase subunit alpha [Bacteroidota bacterium]